MPRKAAITPNERAPDAINPAAMRPEDVAQTLTRFGRSPVSVRSVEADVEAGAPTNRDGTINIVTYTAWMLKEATAGGT